VPRQAEEWKTVPLAEGGSIPRGMRRGRARPVLGGPRYRQLAGNYIELHLAYLSVQPSDLSPRLSLVSSFVQFPFFTPFPDFVPDERCFRCIPAIDAATCSFPTDANARFAITVEEGRIRGKIHFSENDECNTILQK